MIAIRNEQMCSGFLERISKAPTTEAAWTLEQEYHAKSEHKKDFKCGCRLLDEEKGDSLDADWGSGIWVVENGAPKVIAWNYDSSD
jgi:hypothetical protein